METAGTTNATISVEGNSIFTNNFGDGVQVVTLTGSTGTINVTVKNSTFSNANVNGNGGIFFAPFGGPVTFNFDVDSNSFNDIMRPITNLGAINVTDGDLDGSGPTVNGQIRNNTLTNIVGSRGISVVADTFAGPLDLTINNNNIDRLGSTTKHAIFTDVRNNVTNADVRVTNNDIGQNPAPAPAGTLWTAGNGTAEAVLVQCQNTASVNGLLSGNIVDANALLEVMRVRAINSCTNNATVTGNDLNDTNGTHIEFAAATGTGAVVGGNICLNISGNTLPAAGVGVIQINENAAPGQINVTQASAAAVAAANSGATVTVAGSPTFGAPACTQPSAPETVIDEIPGPGGDSHSPGGDVSTPGAPAPQTAVAANNDSLTSRPFISSPRTLASQARGSAAGQTTVVRPAPVERSAAKNVSRTPPKPADDPPGATPPVVTPGGCNPTPGGGGPACTTLTWNIGTLPAGRSVTITFQVQVENPYSGPPQVSNQGSISFGGGGGPVLTDDPSVGGGADPTLTPIATPPDAFIRNARAAEPASGSRPMLFTLALSAPATQSITINYATAAGGINPATAGTDYTAVVGGSTTFLVGQQMKTVSVDILADSDNAETDETFLVNITADPAQANVVVGQGIGIITPGNAAGTVLISEFRTVGPGAGNDPNDDFVEIYNNTDTPLTVASSDGSPGFGLYMMGVGSCDATPVLVGTIPNGTVIPARGHFLFVGATYSLASYAAGDATLTANIDTNANIALFSTTNVLNISSFNSLDGVGEGTNTTNLCALLAEGTNLPGLTTNLTALGQHSFFRTICNQSTPTCPTAGNPKDTNDNTADFTFVDTNGISAGSGQRLGAPGPENLASPIRRDPTIGAVLLDASVAGAQPPNRVRDLTSDPGNNSTFGTMSIRRRFVNNTGAPVTRLRVRIIDMSTFPAPSPAGTADLRARTSPLVVVMGINDTATCSASGAGPPPCTVNVQGTTVETPPAQPQGGGIHSSLAAGTITVGTPLAPGASVNLQFLLGVQATGSFKFFFIVEALP